MTMKKAMTVNGPVDADQLGHILPHEHILMEFPDWGQKPMYPELWEEKISLKILGRLRRDIWSCQDNLRLDDPVVMTQEIATFKQHGGGTIVDVTPIGLKRSVPAVAEIARQTGVHVIVGTGYYIQAGHPQEVASLSEEAISRWLVREVSEGIEDTGIRAGMIGEIGISSMTPDEARVLRAAARAQRETGAPLSIHQFGGNELPQIDAILQEFGVPPERVILCHMSSASAEQRQWAAERGYYIEFDCFGNEYYSDPLAGVIVRDPDRIRMIKDLIARGHLRQILVSQDTALKMLLKKYGGWGYEHLIVNVKPLMLREGLPPKAIDTMLFYNPMRAITYLD
jgi:phosphotriesterase-related protein